MKPIERQLVEYFELQDELHGEIAPEEVVGSPVRVATPVRSTGSPWWAAVAAAVVILVVGVVAVFSMSEPNGQSTAQTPTTVTAQLTGPIVWSKPVDDYLFPRVFELPDGAFIAVSLVGEGADLYSSDGRAWIDVAETASFFAANPVGWIQGNWSVVDSIGEDRDETADGSLAHYRDGSWRLVANVDGFDAEWESMASFDGTSVFIEHRSNADVVWIGDDQTGVVRQTAAPWPVSNVADGWREVPVLTVDGVGFFAYPLDFFNDGTENGVFGTTDTAGIWASADGETWERHSDNPFAPPGVSHLEMNTVGTTLWATVHTGGTAALPNDYFTYWSSIDGVTWVVAGEAVNGQADEIGRAHV